mmetsp:Transcript_5328/g.6223  ORF Transcript_5328/g.6223 Transcript_5328/m.6223 type:complete len:85 (+) Transcript_5328:319-573(+)
MGCEDKTNGMRAVDRALLPKRSPRSIRYEGKMTLADKSDGASSMGLSSGGWQGFAQLERKNLRRTAFGFRGLICEAGATIPRLS